jgi:hypothetical protein
VSYHYPNSREQDKATRTQAQAVITPGRTWDPLIATHGTRYDLADLTA